MSAQLSHLWSQDIELLAAYLTSAPRAQSSGGTIQWVVFLSNSDADGYHASNWNSCVWSRRSHPSSPFPLLLPHLSYRSLSWLGIRSIMTARFYTSCQDYCNMSEAWYNLVVNTWCFERTGTVIFLASFQLLADLSSLIFSHFYIEGVSHCSNCLSYVFITHVIAQLRL